MANNTQLASDNFASGSLAAGWSALTGSVVSVVTGTPKVAEPTSTSTPGKQIWTGLAWPNDHASEAAIALTSEAGSFFTLLVRMQSGVVSGYDAVITNGGATINRLDSGAGTLLATASGVTAFASGDIWTLQAAGACISLYQNGNRVAYYYDTTYTGGSPGFTQSSTVSAAHSQCQGWRGYNAVQQDGIWTKQGIVLSALSGDLPAGIWSPTIIYEGNAQLLSGIVYKMWFSSGTTDTSGGIWYAESLDGKTWTRKSGALISNFSSGHLIKVGSTYYMYCQPLSSLGSGNVALYTSTDGVTFSQVNSNVFAVSGSGWDATTLWDFTPITVIAGTWYALYTAPGTGTKPFTGLATSSDGQTWSRYASNPVISGAWISSAFAEVNGVWYFWLGANSPGQLASGNVNWNPDECVRYSTVDFKTWAVSAHSSHHSQLFESVNAATGQNFPGCIINVGNSAYLYTTGSPNDGGTPQIYQIELAIAPAPIASVVKFLEDGTQPIAIDNFSGTLSNWTTPTTLSALQIVGGKVEASATSTNCGMLYTGTSFASTPDQYSEITIAAVATSNDFLIPLVRGQLGSESFYQGQIAGASGSRNVTLRIDKTVSGTSTQIGATVAITPQIGDVIRLSAVGSSPVVLSLYQNGFLILQVEDFSNAFTSGSPGMLIFTPTLAHAQISSWAGGNANVIPNYPPSGGSFTQTHRDFVNKRGLRHS